MNRGQIQIHIVKMIIFPMILSSIPQICWCFIVIVKYVPINVPYFLMVKLLNHVKY